MNLELRSIAAKGDIRNERLTFRVKTALDVGDYVLLQTSYIEGTLTTNIFNSYWFSYGAVAKGDLVVLYTRSGTNSSKPLKDAGTAHFFYWGLRDPIWDDNERAAVILHAPQWQSKPASELWRR